MKKSEILKEAKKILWRGEGEGPERGFASLGSKYVCICIKSACGYYDGYGNYSIDGDEVLRFVTADIAPYHVYETYLEGTLGGCFTEKRVQELRHQWLDSMIAHYEVLEDIEEGLW